METVESTDLLFALALTWYCLWCIRQGWLLGVKK
jgi:hypothetical protein